MNTTGKAWYTAVIALVILAVTATLCMLAAPAAALDTDRHGRYYAYSKAVRTLNADGTVCITYQPVRKNTRTNKIRYAAKYASGRWIKVDRTNCVEDWDEDGEDPTSLGSPTGFRIINLSKSGRYLTFYTYPNVHDTSDPLVTIYRKDFETNRLIKTGQVPESSFYQVLSTPTPICYPPPAGFTASTPCA